jgi:hypothetical protein
MNYTITSAEYAAADNKSAIVYTIENGAMFVADYMPEWDWLMDWVAAGHSISAYSPPPPPPPPLTLAQQLVSGLQNSPDDLAALKSVLGIGAP